MESNKFLELINKPILTVNNVVRYSAIYQKREESLADHMSEVMLMSYVIARSLNTEFDEELDIGVLLEKVLVHDLDEVLTGDIPRNTKYYSEEGLQAMRDLACDAMQTLSENCGFDIYTAWKQAKDGKEGLILHVSDMLCVARKVINEIEFLHNGYFYRVAYEMKDNLDVLNKHIKIAESFKRLLSIEARMYLSDLVFDAYIHIEGLLADNKDFLDLHDVASNVFTNKSKKG